MVFDKIRGGEEPQGVIYQKCHKNDVLNSRFFLQIFSSKLNLLNLVPTPGPVLSRSMLGLVRLVIRLAKARFGQVGDQLGQVKDQVGQGHGQELDNNEE